MKIKEVALNDLVVTLIPVPVVDPKHVKGYRMFPDLYANIFLCAKKNSGKTCTVAAILKECAGAYLVDAAGVHRLKIWIFSTTASKDPSWIHILAWLDTNGFAHEEFDDIEKLNDLVAMLAPAPVKKEPEATRKLTLNDYREPKRGACKKQYAQPKQIAPENIFIFDDMSSMLRNSTMSTFLKKHRHFKSKMIVFSQHPNDLDLQGRKQLDYWLLFKKHSKKKLHEIYADMDLPIEWEEFEALYDYAVEPKWSFLYVNVNKPEYRMGFGTILELDTGVEPPKAMRVVKGRA